MENFASKKKITDGEVIGLTWAILYNEWKFGIEASLLQGISTNLVSNVTDFG